MKKLILNCPFSPGDALVFTAALRDLHLARPGQYQTDYRGTSPELFHNNPYITPMDDRDGMHIKLSYPMIHASNDIPIHFIQAYHAYLSAGVGHEIPITSARPEVYLSEAEKNQPSPFKEFTGSDAPYWVVVSGGKFDFTNKWPSLPNLTCALESLASEVVPVQIGRSNHYHPRIPGAINMVGETPNMRDVLRLVYHAEGVVCPVTFLMHVAAALKKPCVVLAGGREPVTWNQYPNQQYLHTIGALDCCKAGGCWRSRVVALGDGDPKDQEDSLCAYPETEVPGSVPVARCQQMLTPETIQAAITTFLQGARLPTANQIDQLTTFTK